MAEEKDVSFNIRNEVIDQREEMNDDFIESILMVNRQIDEENTNDESNFFDDIHDKLNVGNDGFNLSQNEIDMDIWQSDSDNSVESLE